MSKKSDQVTAGIEAEVTAAMADIKSVYAELLSGGVIAADGRHKEALDTIDTFCAIALRVIAKTNPSKLKSIATTVAIQSHMVPS